MGSHWIFKARFGFKIRSKSWEHLPPNGVVQIGWISEALSFVNPAHSALQEEFLKDLNHTFMVTTLTVHGHNDSAPLDIANTKLLYTAVWPSKPGPNKFSNHGTYQLQQALMKQAPPRIGAISQSQQRWLRYHSLSKSDQRHWHCLHTLQVTSRSPTFIAMAAFPALLAVDLRAVCVHLFGVNTSDYLHDHEMVLLFLYVVSDSCYCR